MDYKKEIRLLASLCTRADITEIHIEHVQRALNISMLDIQRKLINDLHRGFGNLLRRSGDIDVIRCSHEEGAKCRCKNRVLESVALGHAEMYSYLEKDKLAIAQKELRLVSGLFESVVNRLQNDEQKHWEEMNKLNELFEKENEEFHKYVTKKVIPKLQKLS